LQHKIFCHYRIEIERNDTEGSVQHITFPSLSLTHGKLSIIFGKVIGVLKLSLVLHDVTVSLRFYSISVCQVL